MTIFNRDFPGILTSGNLNSENDCGDLEVLRSAICYFRWNVASFNYFKCGN